MSVITTGVKSTFLRADCSSAPLKPMTDRWEKPATSSGTVCTVEPAVRSSQLGQNVKTVVHYQAMPNELLRHTGCTIVKCNHQNWMLRGERWAPHHFEWLPHPRVAVVLEQHWGGWQWWRCSWGLCRLFLSLLVEKRRWGGGIEFEESIPAHITNKLHIMILIDQVWTPFFLTWLWHYSLSK